MSIDVAKVGLGLAGMAAGAGLATVAADGTRDSTNARTRTTVLGATTGATLLALGIGFAATGAGRSSAGLARTGAALVGAGLGTLIGGLVATRLMPAVDPPAPQPPTGAEPLPDLEGVGKSDREILQAASSRTGAEPAGVAETFRTLMADEYAGVALSSRDAVLLTSAGMENARTGAELATTFVNVEAATDTAGRHITEDLEVSEAADLTRAAVHGGQTGEQAAFVYGGLSADPTVHEHATANQRMRIAATAIEVGAPVEEAVATFNALIGDRFDGATATELTIGALRGQMSAAEAARTHREIMADPEIPATLEAPADMQHVNALAREALAARISGTDAVNVVLDLSLDDFVWNNTETSAHLVDLAAGVMAGTVLRADAGRNGYNGTDGAKLFQHVAKALPNASIDTQVMLTRTAMASGAEAVTDLADSMIEAYRESDSPLVAAAVSPAYSTRSDSPAAAAFATQ